MTARGPKSAETGWPILVRQYRPADDWAGSTRYKTVQGAAKGCHYKLDNPVSVGGHWVIDNDYAMYVEGCDVAEFLRLVKVEDDRLNRLYHRLIDN